LPANAIALATGPCLWPAVPLPATPSTTPVPARFRLLCRRRSTGFSSAECRPPSRTKLSTLYLKMCSSSSWPLEIGDGVFHCQLGFADHGATRALEEAVVSFLGARRPDVSRRPAAPARTSAGPLSKRRGRQTMPAEPAQGEIRP